jgi:peptidoglycan/LPS O-acetylase OafA/YrhL
MVVRVFRPPRRTGFLCDLRVCDFSLLHKSKYCYSKATASLLRRLLRLEPTYLVSLVVTVLLGLYWGQTYSAGQLLSHIAYVVPFTRYEWVNGVYWTLAYEFLFYLFCAFAFPFLWGRAGLVLIMAAVFTLLVPRDHEFGGLIACFGIGAIGAMQYARAVKAAVFLFTISCLLSIILMCNDKSSAIAALFAILVIMLVRVPNSELILKLGSISYPLYVTHIPVMGLCFSAPLALGAGGMLTEHTLAVEFMQRIGVLVACLGVAFTLYLFVDKPARGVCSESPPWLSRRLRSEIGARCQLALKQKT